MVREIYDKALRIVESDIIYWEDKYNFIFSEEISGKVEFDYYDPDMSYQDDVMAFMNAFKENVDRLEEIEKLKNL